MPPNSKPKEFKHPIWSVEREGGHRLFVPMDGEKSGYARCEECQKELKLADYSVSSLIRHLNSTHKELANQLENREQKAQEINKITNFVTYSSGKNIKRNRCLATFLDPRFKHRFATEPDIFLAQSSTWVQQDFEKNERVERNEPEPELLEVTSPVAKRPCTSFFDDVVQVGDLSIGY